MLTTDGDELHNGIAHDYRLAHLRVQAHVRRGAIKADESVSKAARIPDMLATRFIGPPQQAVRRGSPQREVEA